MQNIDSENLRMTEDKIARKHQKNMSSRRGPNVIANTTTSRFGLLARRLCEPHEASARARTVLKGTTGPSAALVAALSYVQLASTYKYLRGFPSLLNSIGEPTRTPGSSKDDMYGVTRRARSQKSVCVAREILTRILGFTTTMHLMCACGAEDADRGVSRQAPPPSVFGASTVSLATLHCGSCIFQFLRSYHVLRTE